MILLRVISIFKSFISGHIDQIEFSLKKKDILFSQLNELFLYFHTLIPFLKLLR